MGRWHNGPGAESRTPVFSLATRRNTVIRHRVWSGRLDSNQRELGPEPSGSTKLPYVQITSWCAGVDSNHRPPPLGALPLSYTRDACRRGRTAISAVEVLCH